MSYQAKALQFSLLIHAVIFALITNTSIPESRLSQPVVIDFAVIEEIAQEAVPPPEKIVAQPQARGENMQKKELPGLAKKYKEKSKIIADAGKKEAPPVKQKEINERTASSISGTDPLLPSDADNKVIRSSFSENSAVAASAPGGSGRSSDSEGGKGAAGSSKSGSGSGGSGEGSSGSLIFGSAAGPKYRHKEMPVYPAMARRLGKEGKIVLRLTIDENGNLVNIEVLENPGYGFAEAAIAAVKKSTFIPPAINGKPIRARVMLPVKFVLR